MKVDDTVIFFNRGMRGFSRPLRKVHFTCTFFLSFGD